MRDSFNDNNKGFSLVELVVVIAIMTILVSTLGYSYRMVASKTATQLAKNIELALEKNRVNAMGKNNASVKFYFVNDDGYYMDDVTNKGLVSELTTTTKIGKKDVTCYYVSDGSSVNINSSNSITYTFNRSDGSLKSITDSDNNVLDKSTAIYVEKNNKKYKITVESLTGRVTLSAL